MQPAGAGALLVAQPGPQWTCRSRRARTRSRRRRRPRRATRAASWQMSWCRHRAYVARPRLRRTAHDDRRSRRQRVGGCGVVATKSSQSRHRGAHVVTLLGADRATGTRSSLAMSRGEAVRVALFYLVIAVLLIVITTK